MPMHDFECPKEHRFEHFEQSWRLMPTHPSCPHCGQPGSRIFVGRWNGIHTEHSSMYGKYNPSLGAVVESYSHKMALMAKYGVEEAADLVKGSRSHWQPEPPKPPSDGVTWTDQGPDVL